MAERYSALHIAAGRNDTRAMEALLAARVDANAVTIWGWTPLMLAEMNSDICPDAVRTLRNHGVDESAKCLRGNTAEHYARHPLVSALASQKLLQISEPGDLCDAGCCRDNCLGIDRAHLRGPTIQRHLQQQRQLWLETVFQAHQLRHICSKTGFSCLETLERVSRVHSNKSSYRYSSGKLYDTFQQYSGVSYRTL